MCRSQYTICCMPTYDKRYGKEESQMPRKRYKRHSEYFRIEAYQILAGISDNDMAKRLGCSRRTYQDKISGWADFTATEAKLLSVTLGETQDSLFFTRDVSKTTQ